MDALSEVLGAVRLTGAVFLEMELRAQWSYLTAPARKIADVREILARALNDEQAGLHEALMEPR